MASALARHPVSGWTAVPSAAPRCPIPLKTLVGSVAVGLLMWAGILTGVDAAIGMLSA